MKTEVPYVRLSSFPFFLSFLLGAIILLLPKNLSSLSCFPCPLFAPCSQVNYPLHDNYRLARASPIYLLTPFAMRLYVLGVLAAVAVLVSSAAYHDDPHFDDTLDSEWFPTDDDVRKLMSKPVPSPETCADPSYNPF